MHFFQSFPRRVLSVLLCSFFFVVLSCQKGDTVDPVSSFPDPMLQRLLDMGFTKENIQDRGNYYLVERDMKFPKKSSLLKGAKVSQLAIGDGPFPTLSIVANITVSVASFPTTIWTNKIVTATNAAIAEWNSIPGCRINFVFEPNGGGDVEVFYDTSLNTLEWGATDTPPGCQVGSDLGLNFETENFSADQLHFLLTHELGHTIGFMHTDGNQLGQRTPVLIPGTPNGDPNSVMNSGTGLSTVYSWSVAYPNGFSTGDKDGAAFLYPSSAPLPNMQNSPNGSNKPVLVTWPPSFMCGFQVDITVKKQGTLPLIKAASSVDNVGSYRFDNSNMTSGFYEVTVKSVNHGSVQITRSNVYWF